MKAVQQKWFVIVAMAFILCLTGLVISGTAFGAGGPQCEDNGDGTVTDNGSGLMWQKATAGEMEWHQAMSYASSLSLGGHSDWGLPSKDELKGLYNSECKKLMDVRSSDYWSSTTYSSQYSTSARRVNFNSGNVYYGAKSSSYYVRAVRAGQ
ncbi:MAG: DUF1566 domain-containing protein [Desulfonatronovibrio sp.]